MRASRPANILLLGAGHAHLEVARRGCEFAAAGHSLTLIDPGAFWYSGMATGMLGGAWGAEADRLDPAPLIRRAGGRFVAGAAAAIDRAAKTVTLESGETLPYDFLSLNIGSVTAAPFALDAPGVWPVKPIENLYRLRAALEAGEGAADILVIGGGAAGCECAANLLALARRTGRDLRVTLASSAPRLLEDWPPDAARAMAAFLTRHGATLRLNAPVADLAPGAARLQSGETLPFTHALIATGLKVPPLIESFILRSPGLPGRHEGLPQDPRAGLTVTETLQSPEDPAIFAAGDCAAIAGHSRPNLGVFGVRAAPTLARNLLAAANGQPLRRYRPQPLWFSALDLGNGSALARYGPLWAKGRAMQWLKRWLDERFMRRYR
ncbi:NAD(P)/FAD-dependent oxidoreductase [Euryhalocaulis caribicus]|uniref:NAD(P)/FAD-dependent oxidoreductase n=1 Tax=Euryhalocaulis caribicus TaxID=1161401 RepID=UPI00039E2AD6|nr:FAD-dependent oxidoreductase [Euryhalocaulis caribicus]